MCYKCGNFEEIAKPVPRSAVCGVCGADIRCCKNCAFYEEGAHYDCRETINELVRDKEKANFCEYFSYTASGKGKGENAWQEKKAEAKKAFDSLFGA